MANICPICFSEITDFTDDPLVFTAETREILIDRSWETIARTNPNIQTWWLSIPEHLEWDIVAFMIYSVRQGIYNYPYAIRLGRFPTYQLEHDEYRWSDVGKPRFTKVKHWIHIKEIQERINEVEEDTGLSITAFTSCNHRLTGVHIREIRIAIERLITFNASNKEHYFNFDTEGNDMRPGNHQLDWSEEIIDDLTIIKTPNIEELRHPILTSIFNIKPSLVGSGEYTNSWTGHLVHSYGANPDLYYIDLYETGMYDYVSGITYGTITNCFSYIQLQIGFFDMLHGSTREHPNDMYIDFTVYTHPILTPTGYTWTWRLDYHITYTSGDGWFGWCQIPSPQLSVSAPSSWYDGRFTHWNINGSTIPEPPEGQQWARVTIPTGGSPYVIIPNVPGLIEGYSLIPNTGPNTRFNPDIYNTYFIRTGTAEWHSWEGWDQGVATRKLATDYVVIRGANP